MAKVAFLMAHSFLSFKNANQKDICASVVIKAKSKPKREETFFWEFSLKTKNPLFQGSKIVVFTTQISREKNSAPVY